MRPDENRLRNDFIAAGFQIGEARGKWSLVTVEFPFVYVRISAPTRTEGPPAFLLRLNCVDYPASAPTAQLWDGRSDAPLPLAQRPHGCQAVLTAFSEWQPCLYHPIDRLARQHWPGQFEELAWHPDSDITHFLEAVHALIHDPEYVRSTAPAEAAELQRVAVAVNPERAA